MEVNRTTFDRKMYIFVFFLHLLTFTCIFDICSGLIQQTFSTKTTYEASFTPSELGIRDRGVIFQHHSCQPIFTDVVLRHGIRNPGKKDIIRVDDLYKRLINDTGIEDLHEHLKSWSNRFPVSSEKHISQTGRDEQIDIGERIGLRLKRLLSELDISDVAFITSETNRTIESCYSFQAGLSNVGFKNLKQTCVIDNDILRFFDACEQYLALKNSGIFSKEYNVLKDSSLFHNMMAAFKERNFIPEKFKITAGTNSY